MRETLPPDVNALMLAARAAAAAARLARTQQQQLLQSHQQPELAEPAHNPLRPSDAMAEDLTTSEALDLLDPLEELVAFDQARCLPLDNAACQPETAGCLQTVVDEEMEVEEAPTQPCLALGGRGSSLALPQERLRKEQQQVVPVASPAAAALPTSPVRRPFKDRTNIGAAVSCLLPVKEGAGGGKPPANSPASRSASPAGMSRAVEPAAGYENNRSAMASCLAPMLQVLEPQTPSCSAGEGTAPQTAHAGQAAVNPCQAPIIVASPDATAIPCCILSPAMGMAVGGCDPDAAMQAAGLASGSSTGQEASHNAPVASQPAAGVSAASLEELNSAFALHSTLAARLRSQPDSRTRAQQLGFRHPLAVTTFANSPAPLPRAWQQQQQLLQSMQRQLQLFQQQQQQQPMGRSPVTSSSNDGILNLWQAQTPSHPLAAAFHNLGASNAGAGALASSSGAVPHAPEGRMHSQAAEHSLLPAEWDADEDGPMGFSDEGCEESDISDASDVDMQCEEDALGLEEEEESLGIMQAAGYASEDGACGSGGLLQSGWVQEQLLLGGFGAMATLVPSQEQGSSQGAYSLPLEAGGSDMHDQLQAHTHVLKLSMLKQQLACVTDSGPFKPAVQPAQSGSQVQHPALNLHSLSATCTAKAAPECSSSSPQALPSIQGHSMALHVQPRSFPSAAATQPSASTNAPTTITLPPPLSSQHAKAHPLSGFGALQALIAASASDKDRPPSPRPPAETPQGMSASPAVRGVTTRTISSPVVVSSGGVKRAGLGLAELAACEGSAEKRLRVLESAGEPAACVMVQAVHAAEDADADMQDVHAAAFPGQGTRQGIALHCQ